MNEANNSDKDTKCLLILQTSSFFHELINDLPETSLYVPKIKAAVGTFIKAVKENLALFLENEERSKQLSELLTFFVCCQIKNCFAQELCGLVVSALYSDYENHPNFTLLIPFIDLFFQIQEFSSVFEMQGGLFALWDIFKSEPKYFMSSFVETIKQKYLQSKDPSEASPFISYIAVSINELPESSAQSAFQFIFNIFSNQKCDLVSVFAEHGGFNELNSYILSHNQSTFLLTYQLFRVFSTSADAKEMSPVISGLINLISTPELKSNVRSDALAILLSIIKEFSADNNQIQANDIYVISTVTKTPEEVNALIEIIFFMSTSLGYDSASLFPAVSKIFSVDASLCETLGVFKLLRFCWNDLSPFGPDFILEIIKSCKGDEFAELLNKYEDLYKCINLCLSTDCPSDDKKKMLNSVIKSGPKLHDKSGFMSVICDALFSDDLRISVIQESLYLAKQKELLSLIYSAVMKAAGKPFIRRKFIEQKVIIIIKELYINGGLSSDQVLDIIKSFSSGYFVRELNDDVYQLFETTDLNSLPEDRIRETAFFQNESNAKNLIFPSILYCCGEFSLSTPFDLWLAAQYGLKYWLIKTNKSIDQFPEIKRIAQRFILPEHAKMIIERHSLLSNCCSSSFGVVPLFQFSDNLMNTQLNLHVGNIINGGTVSFWFYFETYPSSQQTIVEIAGQTISVRSRSESLFIGEQEVCHIQLNRWNHLVLTNNEKNILTLFVNGNQMATVHSTFNPVVVLGSSKNHAQWYIGGAIRVISSVLLDEAVQRIFNNGVFTTTKFIQNEKFTLTADTFVKHFGDKLNGKVLSENSTPVPVFSVQMHLYQAYNGNNFLFEKIVDFIANDKKEDVTYFVRVMCNLQKLRLSKWSIKEFALHVSSLFAMIPDIFDGDLLTLIFSLFQINADIIDWDSLLILILDPGLFNMQGSSFIISQMFGFIVQCPLSNDNNLLDALYMFVFVARQLSDISDDLKQTMDAFISKIKPSVNSFIMSFTSIDGMKDFFVNPHFKYSSPVRAQLYNYYATNMLEYITNDFLHYFIFRVMTPDDALDSIFMYVSKSYKQSDYSIDKHFIMRFCIEYSYIPISWSISLSLLSKSVISVIDNVDFVIEKLDASVLPEFLIMLSILLSAALTLQEGSFWQILLSKIMEQIVNIAVAIPIKMINERLIFSISNFISCGLFVNSITFFPFSPNNTDPENIIEKSMSRGQKFECSDPPCCPPPLINFFPVDDEMVDIVYQSVKNIVPYKINFLPPCQNISISSQAFDIDRASCKTALNQNLKQVYTSWAEFIEGIRKNINASDAPSIEKIHSSPYILDMIHFIVKLLFRTSVDDPKKFSEMLNVFCLTQIQIIPKHSMFVMQKIIFMLFEDMSSEGKYSEYLIKFTCERIKEGWFSDSVSPVLSLMLTNINLSSKHVPVPLFLVETLLFCFDILEEEQLYIFTQIFISFESILFTEQVIQNIDLCKILLYKCISCKHDGSKQISSILVNMMSINEQILSKWEESIPLHELREAMSLREIGKGYEKWISENQAQYTNFIEECKGKNDAFMEKQKEDIINSLKLISQLRSDNSNTFSENADRFIRSIHTDIATSRSTFAVIRHFYYQLYIFDCEFFLRLREAKITSHNLFAANKGKVKTFSLLSDPLYPTKRFEESPAIYNLPEYPSGSPDECNTTTPDIEEPLLHWPIQLRNIMMVPYKYFEIISLHSEKQVLLSFSQKLPISGVLELSILQAITNLGVAFDLLQNVGFLYGVEPLKGIIMKAQNSFFFLPGFGNSEYGIFEENEEMYPLLFKFYVSYMITGNFGIPLLFSGHPIIKLPFHNLIGVINHIWLQRRYSIECFFLTGWSFVLVSNEENYKELFKSLQNVADQTFSTLPPKSNCLSPIISMRQIKNGLSDATRQWQEGLIDNFTYLCLLNRFGLRSYCDFSQYFIIPWVISDYDSETLLAGSSVRRDLSLPMGQIGEKRRQKFDQIFEDSNNEYYYGSHYMHFGVVIYFLFRVDPFCLFSLYLHHGWDHPNRIFFDMKESWGSAAMYSPSDVKELIPQIVYVPEVLENISDINLAPKENVKLGGWSSNSRDFTDKMMKALNDEETSAHIQNWIDMIFGYKQQGKEAVKSKNLFHPLCYPHECSAIDKADDDEKEAISTCVINFGQCPIQLFKKQHPTRNCIPESNHIMSDPSNIIIVQHLNKESFTLPITDVFIENDKIFTTDGTSIIIQNNPASVAFIYPIKLGIFVGQQNNMIKYTKLLRNSSCVIQNASLFAPSCYTMSSDGLFFGVGQYESAATIFQLTYNKEVLNGSCDSLCFKTHGPVQSICISSSNFIVGCACGSILERYCIGTRRVLKCTDVGFTISHVVFDDSLASFICCGKEIAIVSVSGDIIYKRKVDSRITAVKTTNLSSDVKNKFFVVGAADGKMMFWAINDEKGEIECLKSIQISNQPITRIAIDSTCQRIICCTVSEIYELSYVGSSLKPLRKEYVNECCNCKSTDCQKLRACNNCHRYVCDNCAKELPEDQAPIKKVYCDSCYMLLSNTK